MFHDATLLLDDVIVEIMSWLPPDTLLTTRSVCKLWNSTINNAKFIAMHKSHFGNPLRNNNNTDTDHGHIIILTERYPDLKNVLKLRILPDNNNPEVIFNEENDTISTSNRKVNRVTGSCNGLICYASLINDMEIQLFNPFIRRAILIPTYRLTDRFPIMDCYYGVGFDHLTNDYKVIKFLRIVRYIRGHGPGVAAVYSVKDKSWRRLNIPVPSHVTKGRSIFLHGNIHWLSYSVKTHSMFRVDKITLFDVCNEVFREMELPVATNRPSDITISISVVKGSLCLLVTTNWVCDNKNKMCDVWVMEEYGVAESWTKKFSFVLKKEIMICKEVTPGGKILCMVEEGLVILYDPETDEYRNLGVAPTCTDHVFSSVASLEFPHCPI